MKKSFLLAVLLVFVSANAFAKIVEEGKMAKAVQSVDKETLLIFDIDNTIIEPVQQLGSNQWYFHEYDKYIKDGLSPKDAHGKVFPVWLKILKTMKVRPVEQTTPGLIYAAQRKGVKIMALTARPATIKDITIEELRSAGVDLSLSPPAKDGGGFFGGVLFVGLENDKGVVLNEFMAKTGMKPKRVVFVDDVKKNIEVVDKALASNGIECLCVRYGAADKRVKSFNPAIADIQLANLEQNLSDEDAKKLLKKKK